MLRIGLIGCGHHGRNAVIPALRKYAKRTQLVAVADLNPQNLAAIEPPALSTYTDYHKMFRDEKLDAVFVATLMDTHQQIVNDALGAGLHVICEKPMAPTAAACKAMTEAAQRAGRLLIIDFEMRTYPHMLAIRNWIDKGYLGRIEAVHLQRMWDGHKSTGPLAERRGRLLRLAGALDCGIHDLDMVRFFTGGAGWQSIEARGSWMGESFEFPPHISVIARMDNGALATVSASMAYAAHIKARPMLDTMHIVGREGLISISMDASGPEEFFAPGAVIRLQSDRHSETVPSVHPPHEKSIAVLADTVAGMARGEPAPHLATGLDGYLAQVAVEAANRSAIEEAASCGAPVLERENVAV